MLRRVPLFQQFTVTTRKVVATTTSCVLGTSCSSTFRFCSSSSNNNSVNFESQVAAIFTASGQHSILSKKRQQLEDIQKELFEKQTQLDAIASKKPDFLAKLTLGYLIIQSTLLNYWVYNRFDWCLVEPITYLLGTAVTFIAIGYYLFTGAEYDYDVLRKSVYQEQRKQIYAKHNFNVERMEELVKEIEILEEEIEHSVPNVKKD